MYLSTSRPLYDQVVCRPALPLDTPGMLEITKQIWEGEDYLPKAWQDWLFDPDGLLAIAEFRSKIIGIGKLTKLSEEDWWMEGLRVHPQFEGHRIASRIHRYLLDIWEKTASGSIRFATVSSREPVKHLARINGFHVAGEYSTFKAGLPDILEETRARFSLVKIGDLAEAVDWLRSSSGDKLPFGLMNLGWQFAPPREEYLAGYIENDQAWWWNRKRGLIIVVEKVSGPEILGRVRLLAVNPGDMSEILVDAHCLVNQIGYSGLAWLAPLIHDIEDISAEAGFFRDWESSLLVYERSSNSEGFRPSD